MTFAPVLKQFKVIALTHRHLGLDLVGKFHIEAEHQRERFSPHLDALDIKEFMFLSTCNRVEFFFRGEQAINEGFVQQMLQTFYTHIDRVDIEHAAAEARSYEGIEAVRHIFHVAGSLDSLVIGEREIITQVRAAYERARDSGFTGDFIRIAVRKAIETAKQIYTETEIATKPISVVNLAYRKLLEHDLSADQSIVYIGAGQSIEAIAGNLKKHNFKEVKVFNRTLSKAKKLAEILGGHGFGLNELASKAGDFDILVTCTGADGAIVTEQIIERWNLTGKKIIVDLALPADVDPKALKKINAHYIGLESLKEEAKRNLKEREKEVFRCEALVEARLLEFEDAYKTRKLELAMQQVPQMMKEIKLRALDKTFARDLNSLDSESRATLEKIVDYLEKKYIAIPMKLAKQVMLEQDLKDPIIE